MALRKTLTSNHRLFNLTKISSPSLNLTQSHSPFPPDDLSKVLPDSSSKTAAGSSGWFFRRFLQKRPIVQSAMKQELLDLPTGDKLMDKLRGMNVHGNRLRLDGLISPSPVPVPVPSLDQISVEDAKKLLRLAQLETVKSMLRSIPKTSISYSEFLQICKEGSSSGSDQGSRLAKTLDESGAVIVLRDTVFLRPEQITKAIEGVIPLTVVRPNDPRREELTKMEKEKAAIDEEAEALVRKELWAGLGFLIVQTAGFMRLTFWELSWDVMEPVCFYVTSMYFMAGYTFFLRTSKDPSFEGFFESRFSAKQKRLMKVKKFDVERFKELKRAFYPYSSEPSAASASSFERTLMCAH